MVRIQYHDIRARIGAYVAGKCKKCVKKAQNTTFSAPFRGVLQLVFDAQGRRGESPTSSLEDIEEFLQLSEVFLIPQNILPASNRPETLLVGSKMISKIAKKREFLHSVAWYVSMCFCDTLISMFGNFARFITGRIFFAAYSPKNSKETFKLSHNNICIFWKNMCNTLLKQIINHIFWLF